MRRRLVFTLALLAAVAAGVASASAITAQLGPDVAVSPADVKPDGSGTRVPVTAADPDGGRPAFALRVYRSEGGLTCPEVGRSQDGAYGQLDAGGEFKALPADAAGSCVDLGKDPIGFAVNHYTPRNAKLPARAAIFGVTTSEVTAIALSVGDVSRPVKVNGGGFLTVVREDALAGATLDVTLRDGTTTSYPLSPQTLPQTLPAPGVEEAPSP
jgi:hypothetical protein